MQLITLLALLPLLFAFAHGSVEGADTRNLNGYLRGLQNSTSDYYFGNNTGDYYFGNNTGDYYFGNNNTGDYYFGNNTSDYYFGNNNTGDYYFGNNTGDYYFGNNTGDYYFGNNTGDYYFGNNTSDYYFGNNNTGDYYFGNNNTGDYYFGNNTGDYYFGNNTGDYYFGNNTGDYYFGNNTGDYYSDIPTITPTQSPTEFPTSDNFNYEFYYSDIPTISPTQNPTLDNFNYFGDYYFNYYNDGASCDREERLTIRDLTGFFDNTLEFVREIESTCGENGSCIASVLSSLANISFDCSDCFTDFIFDLNDFCQNDCFGENFVEFLCSDCIENFTDFSEVQFENCIGVDLFSDDEFNTCSEQLEAEEIIDLPRTLQQLFENNCRNGGFSTLSGSKCMTSEAFFNFQVDEDCADCIGAHAICVNEFCSSQCLFGDLSDCIGCVENSRCASDFDNCSGLNLYFRGNGYNFGNYYGFYNTGNYYGGNVVFDTIIAIFNDFFVNFIGEFINNFSILLFGE